MLTLVVHFAVLLVLAAFLAWRVAERWWHYLVLAALTVLLCPYVAQHIAGDMGRYFPDGTFSDGGQGKDEIIIVSAASTLIFAVIGAACVVWAGNALWRVVKARRAAVRG